MSKGKIAKTVDLSDQELDKVQGGRISGLKSDRTTATTIKTQYKIFLSDGTPVRSADSDPTEFNLGGDFAP